MIGGDYNRIMSDELCHSATNYECYKGMFSSFNSMNMFEIVHSLLRQFGPENWTLYKGKHLLSFVDNHDVSRIASTLSRPEHLKLIYILMFGMPGIPTIYYGSEWGEKADKSQGDPALRPCFDSPNWNDLTDVIAALCKAREGTKALSYGGFSSLLLTNRQCIFEREADGDRMIVVINADENSFHADFNARAGRGKDVITGKEIDFGGGLDIPPYTGYLIQV
jgi:glycosidase